MCNFQNKPEDSLVEVFYESMDENGHKHYGVEQFDTTSSKPLPNACQALQKNCKKS